MLSLTGSSLIPDQGTKILASWVPQAKKKKRRNSYKQNELNVARARKVGEIGDIGKTVQTSLFDE